MKMTPDQAVAWLNVVAILVQLGKTTEEEVAALYRQQRGPTDADTQAADDAALIALGVKIATYRQEAHDAANPVNQKDV
jgi:hypothetical protein